MSVSAKMCEVVSDLEHLTETKIKEVIENQKCIDKWLYILHDKDVQEDGTPKNPHYHVYLHFNNARCFDNVAKWFGVSTAFVSKIHGRFGDAIEYAIHANALEKHQYSVDEVKANFDFVAAIAKNQDRKKDGAVLSDIIARIDSGEIRPYNITAAVSMANYVKYKRMIDTAFDYRLKRLSLDVSRKMDVMYVYGGSGSGKTTYAKFLAEKQGYSTFVSSGSNDPFYGYGGQDCVILDDLRGDVFPTADLLKILDNNTATTVKARYRNVALECKLLIITTIKTPMEFFRDMFDSAQEEYKQFARRCTMIARMSPSKIWLYSYNRMTDKPDLLTEIENPISTMYAPTADEDIQNKLHALQVFGVTPVPTPEPEYWLDEFVKISD